MTDYPLLSKQLEGLLTSETHPISNMSQFSAFVFNALEDINWAGFYWVDKDKNLRLGPFQGQVACTHISFGAGVCGTALKDRSVTRVADVHRFDGHIACDSRSNSEIVLPIFFNDEVVAVFDIDSPSFERFDEDDEKGLNQLIKIFERATDFTEFSF